MALFKLAEPADVAPAVSPHDLGLERALLALIIADNSKLDTLNPLQPEDLYDHTHGAVLASAMELRAEGRPVNLVTLRARFGAVPFASGGTVIEYLGTLSLSGELPAIADIVSALRELKTRREMQILGERIAGMAWDQAAGPAPLLADASKSLDDLLASCRAGKITLRSAEQAIDELMLSIREGDKSFRIPTGFLDLDKMTGGLRKKEYCILAGRTSMGKEQPLDAKILLRNGSWTTMGALKLGDELASIDGERSRVSGIFPQGEKQIFRISFSDGRSAETGADHLWRIHCKYWPAPRILSTAVIEKMLKRKRYQSSTWIDRVDGNFGEDENIEIDGYTLGSLIANGGLTGRSVRITTPHPGIVDKICATTGLRASVDRLSLTYGLCGSGDVAPLQGALRSLGIMGLRSLGIMGLRSEHKFIPPQYLRASRAVRADLLRGLLDGDGWVEKFGAIRYATSSHQLAKDVRDLARSLGAVVTISEKNPRYTHKGEIKTGLKSYCLCLSFEGGGGGFLSIESKRTRTLNRTRISRLRFVSIVPTRKAQAQCITVTHPSRLYVTDSYIVTHNSAAAVVLAARAARAGHAALIFSLEMTTHQWMARTVADGAWQSTGATSYADALRGKLNEHQMRMFETSARDRRSYPMFIDEQGGLTVVDIIQRTRQMRERLAKDGQTLDLVIVDHLGKVKPTRNYRGNRVHEMEEISGGMAEMAKTEDVALLALHQLNRAVESRDNKRPGLADLRDSGSLEQDADTVLLCYRPAYYLERQKEDDADREAARYEMLEKVRHVLEINVAKQRNGPTETVELYVDMAANAIRDKWRGG